MSILSRLYFRFQSTPSPKGRRNLAQVQAVIAEMVSIHSFPEGKEKHALSIINPPIVSFNPLLPRREGETEMNIKLHEIPMVSIHSFPEGKEKQCAIL